jgi:NAD(P)-dependent dehydrogenase (short-subunit alcohol dehydrogenase family)
MIDYLNKFRLDKKVAVVCGGLGLIGNEVSIALAQAGAKVLVLDISDVKGKEFEKQCAKEKLDVKYITFDITDLNHYDKKISDILKKEGTVHIWINVAYPKTKDWGAKLEDVKIKSWQENIDMHMNAYCLLTRTAAELMKKNEIRGSIINFGSTYGVVGPDFGIYDGTTMTNQGEYAAIKGGIINFSKYCASYYGPFGIRVNSLCPGGVYNNQNKTFLKNYVKRTPLRRMAHAEDIAAATLFLASDAALYITGTAFMVDGGWTCI